MIALILLCVMVLHLYFQLPVTARFGKFAGAIYWHVDDSPVNLTACTASCVYAAVLLLSPYRCRVYNVL